MVGLTALLLTLAVASLLIGLALIDGASCSGWCGRLALTLVYAGGPVSGLFGVLTTSLVVAWPLDLILWVALGFLLAGRRRPARALFLTIAAALVYGLVLSGMVELAR